MKELMTINYTSLEYQDAMQLHAQIMTSGALAAESLVNMCHGLKKMRDTKQYTYLGYESFDDYVTIAAGMKARQAYTYISTIERLGESLLQSNANLGITKLSLLASVSEGQREDILENNVIEDMSTRELQVITDQLTKAQEQISLLTEETGIAAKTNASYMAEIMNAERAKEAAQEDLKKYMEKEKTAAPEVDWEAIKAEKDKAVADAKKLADKIWMEKFDTVRTNAVAIAQSDAADQVKKAREQGAKEAQEAAQKTLEIVDREKADAVQRAQELEKKLQVSGNTKTVLFSLLFSEIQQQFNKLNECLGQITEEDAATGDKYKDAMIKLLNKMLDLLCGLPEDR